MFVCVVLSRSLDERFPLEVTEAAATERLLWSWLEFLLVPGWESNTKILSKCFDTSVTLTLAARGGR